MIDIEQYVLGMTPEGEAVVVYTITSEGGVSVKLCNVGAQILTITLQGDNGGVEEFVVGESDYKGLIASFKAGGAFSGQAWESSVEGDRVVFGLFVSDSEGAGSLRIEVSYVLNERSELEVLTMAYSASERVIDLSSLNHFDLAFTKEVLSDRTDVDLSNIALQSGETYVNRTIYRLKQ